MNEAAIELRGIFKSYGNKHVLTGLDLACRRARCWDCWAPTGRARPR